MKVSELGEFGLIARIVEELSEQPTRVELLVGIGDDAAVWRCAQGAQIATTDTLVAGVHFTTELAAWRDIGWKAIATNVSDIAAMGGTPTYALVTLGLPGDTAVEDVVALYAGMAEACRSYGATVAGGDVVGSPVPFITVSLSGLAELDDAGEPRVLRRDAAEAGDLIAVSGSLGCSAAGLLVLQGKLDAPIDVRQHLVDAHTKPQARLAAGRAAVAAGVRCAIDVSDGLLRDAGHLCETGQLGAVVWRDRIPVNPWLSSLLSPEEATRLAATGGEDYELVFTGTQEQVDAVRRAVDVPITVIGEIVLDPRRRTQLLDESGEPVDLPSFGWDHFEKG